VRHDPELLAALEPRQYASAKQTPFPRRKLGRGVLALLTLLRVYVLIAISVVAYAFIHALGTPG
jgi:hypothetical protein